MFWCDFQPKRHRINWNNLWCDANAVLFYLFWQTRLASTSCPRAMSKKLLHLPKSQCTRPHVESERNRARLLDWGFCSQHRTGACSDFSGKNDGRGPFGLSLLDDFQVDHLGSFILIELLCFWFILVWCRMDWSGIFRQCLNPMLSCLYSAQ